MNKDLIITVCKCVSLGLGIGVTCLSLLNALELNNAITLLALGLTSLSFSLFIEGSFK
ncbi:MAG: hypothetical protein Q4B63_04600 [Clostridium perfringens]|nr:hypothetical protein [Clostridium perfringens]